MKTAHPIFRFSVISIFLLALNAQADLSMNELLKIDLKDLREFLSGV